MASRQFAELHFLLDNRRVQIMFNLRILNIALFVLLAHFSVIQFTFGQILPDDETGNKIHNHPLLSGHPFAPETFMHHPALTDITDDSAEMEKLEFLVLRYLELENKGLKAEKVR